jgi:hypothetical protein
MCAVRIVAAIVLLLWAVCYGRCLAEQNGLLAEQSPTLGCVHSCCESKDSNDQDQPPAAPKDDDLTCDLCELIKSGGVPTAVPLEMQTGLEWVLHVPLNDYTYFALLAAKTVESATEFHNTGPPDGFKLCEWMASTAMPVRGPTLVA